MDAKARKSDEGEEGGGGGGGEEREVASPFLVGQINWINKRAELKKP